MISHLFYHNCSMIDNLIPTSNKLTLNIYIFFLWCFYFCVLIIHNSEFHWDIYIQMHNIVQSYSRTSLVSFSCIFTIFSSKLEPCYFGMFVCLFCDLMRFIRLVYRIIFDSLLKGAYHLSSDYHWKEITTGKNVSPISTNN